MSATKRGTIRDVDDHYATPAWAVQQLLERERFGAHVLDAGCGGGSILRHFDKRVAWGIEVNPERAQAAIDVGLGAVCGDFLSEPVPLSPDAVVMNPPFGIARQFILRALHVVRYDGKVAALLRLNFLASSRKRMDVVGPGSGLIRVHVMSKRPSFLGGKTDACDYAWFVWRQGYKGAATVEVMPMPQD